MGYRTQADKVTQYTRCALQCSFPGSTFSRGRGRALPPLLFIRRELGGWQSDGTELPPTHHQLSAQTAGEVAFSRRELRASPSLQVCI